MTRYLEDQTVFIRRENVKATVVTVLETSKTTLYTVRRDEGPRTGTTILCKAADLRKASPVRSEHSGQHH